MALRRELEEKRRRAEKVKEPELTAKQRDAVRCQLEKESTIREKLSKLDSQLQAVVSMTMTAATGNLQELSLYFLDLLWTLLRNLQSPLAAPHLSQLFVCLAACLFRGYSAATGELVSNVTLHLLAPCCDLNS